MIVSFHDAWWQPDGTAHITHNATTPEICTSLISDFNLQTNSQKRKSYGIQEMTLCVCLSSVDVDRDNKILTSTIKSGSGHHI